MNQERKKSEVKPRVKPVIPKKREVTEEPQKISVVEVPNKEERKRKSEFKTLRVASNADIEERKHISDRVQKGELSLAYYAVDGDNSYHYYFINKN
jgi:microcompartment protein CcmL/EutN